MKKIYLILCIISFIAGLVLLLIVTVHTWTETLEARKLIWNVIVVEHWYLFFPAMLLTILPYIFIKKISKE